MFLNSFAQSSIARVAAGVAILLTVPFHTASAAEWFEDATSIDLNINVSICNGINGGVESGTNFAGLKGGYAVRKNLKFTHPSQGKAYIRVRPADYSSLQTSGKYKVLSTHVLTKQESTLLRKWFSEMGSGMLGWLNIATGFAGFFSAIVGGASFVLTLADEAMKYGKSKYPETLALNIDKDDKLDVRLSALSKDGKSYLLMGTYFNSADGKFLIPVCGGIFAVSPDATAPAI